VRTFGSQTYGDVWEAVLRGHSGGSCMRIFGRQFCEDIEGTVLSG